MAEDGEDKLLAVARHIAKTLGRTETMTDDILQIFSTFDGRFSREKLSEAHLSPAAAAEAEDDYGDRDRRISYNPMEHTFRSIDQQICRLASSESPIWSDSGAASAFLAAIDDLLAVLRGLPSSDPLIDRADELLQQSMLRLEDEFRALMDTADGAASDPSAAADASRGSPYDSYGEESDGEDRIPVAQPVSGYDVVIDALPPGTIADLHNIARRMVAAGYAKECTSAYSLSRRDFLEESVSRLGLRPRSVGEIQATPWEDLEDEITRWTRAMTVAARILFPSERRLCDRVFAGLGPASDLAFAETCRGTALRLLGLADAVSMGSRAPERLFRVVDMYDALRDVVPDLEDLFSDQYSSSLRSESIAIWKGLGTAIRGIFMELENLIRRDPAKAPVPGGALHPITRYVMNYLRAACSSRRTLEEVVDDDGGAGPGAAPPTVAGNDRHESSSLAVQIAWIMEVLQANLEAKSKIYKDPSLNSVFLINNGRYIIQKGRDGELGALLGDDWIRRETARVKRWQGDYLRQAWGKVVAVLRTDSGGGAATRGAGATAKALRERLRIFNAYLEDICSMQAGWVVVDEQMREELKSSTAEMVLPAYRSFLGTLRIMGAEEHVRYGPEDVEGMIDGLFQGGGRNRS